jgi:hypothetical protein
VNVEANRAIYTGLGALNVIGGVGALVKMSVSLDRITPELVIGFLAALSSVVLLTLARIPMPRPASAIELVDDVAERTRVCAHYPSTSVVVAHLEELGRWQDEVLDKQRFAERADVASRIAQVNELRVATAKLVHDAEVERVMERQRPWVLTVAAVLLVTVGACVTSLAFRSPPPTDPPPSSDTARLVTASSGPPAAR